MGAFRHIVRLFIAGALLTAPRLAAIDCDELQHVTDRMLRDHYVWNRFDAALSNRVLDRCLTYLDPGRMIFLKEDVETLRKDYGDDVDLWLLAEQCGFLDRIQSLYLQRTQERFPLAQALCQLNFDFSITESQPINRDRTFLPDSEALRQRWRQRVKHQFLQLQLSGLSEDSIRSKLEHYYQEKLNAPERLTELELRHKFLGAFARTLDPHSKYYPPENAEDIRISLGKAFFGIGTTIETRNESFFIIRIAHGGPAHLSGKLQVGDQILAVANPPSLPQQTFGQTLTELIHQIRGEEGAPVTLTVHRQSPTGSAIHNVTLIRNRIDPTVSSAQKALYAIHDKHSPETPLLRVGVISLANFYLDTEAMRRREPNYRRASRDVRRLIQELQKSGIDALILDLRDNGGGVLSEAIAVAGLFIDEGPVVQKQDSFGYLTVMDDRNPALDYGGPLTVLIDSGSASASEIVSGALQDYRRALIIGTRNTFGKGTVQVVASVDRREPELGSFKLTSALYFLPSGRTPQHSGIIPDLKLNAPDGGGLRSMADYDNAIPPETLPTAAFTPVGSDEIIGLETLKQRSAERTEGLFPDLDAWAASARPKKISLQAADYAGASEDSATTADQAKAVLEEAIRVTADYARLGQKFSLHENYVVERVLEDTDIGSLDSP